LICADPELSRRDEELFSYYAKAKATAADPMAFKKEAESAWRERESTCRDKACLSTWYSSRIAHYQALLTPATVAQPATPAAENAAKLAMLDRQIEATRQCVESAQNVINTEQEIGAASGYVSKPALYEAGQRLVMCRHSMESLQEQKNALLGKPPKSRGQSGAAQAFSLCIDGESHKAQYTSFDGGHSALLMLGACETSWKAFVAECVARGDTEQTCNLTSAIAAQIALKKLGK
jgi:hypothetical protein